jgi:transposase
VNASLNRLILIFLSILINSGILWEFREKMRKKYKSVEVVIRNRVKSSLLMQLQTQTLR